MFIYPKSPKGSLGNNSIYLKSVILYWEMEKAKLLKLELLPTKLGFSDGPYNVYGCPQPAEPSLICDEIVTVIKCYGTKFEITDRVIRVII